MANVPAEKIALGGLKSQNNETEEEEESLGKPWRERKTRKDKFHLYIFNLRILNLQTFLSCAFLSSLHQQLHSRSFSLHTHDLLEDEVG